MTRLVAEQAITRLQIPIEHLEKTTKQLFACRLARTQIIQNTKEQNQTSPQCKQDVFAPELVLRRKEE